MTRDEFERLLLTHGADPGRWPPPLRGPAEVLLRNDPAAAALQAEAARLDRLVSQAASAPAAGAALAGRIAAAIAPDAAPSPGAAGERAFGLGRLAALSGSVAAAALVAGFFYGQNAAGLDFTHGMLALVGGDAAETEVAP